MLWKRIENELNWKITRDHFLYPMMKTNENSEFEPFLRKESKKEADQIARHVICLNLVILIPDLAQLWLASWPTYKLIDIESTVNNQAELEQFSYIMSD